jgi:ABC-type dipeptide/oligopeptide/nickel transport system permease component
VIKYALQRVFLMLPTLLGITMITYCVALLAPGDPVQAVMGSEGMEQGSANRDAINQMRVLYGLAYVQPIEIRVHPANSVKGLSRPDLHALVGDGARWSDFGGPDAAPVGFIDALTGEALKRNLFADIGIDESAKLQWNVVEDVDAAVASTPGAIGFAAFPPTASVRAVPLLDGEGKAQVASVDSAKTGDYFLRHYSDKGAIRGYVEWLGALVQGDFGMSTRDQRPVLDKILAAIQPTLLLSFLAILISYIVAIPIGVHAAVKQNSLFDQASTVMLFVLYSLPSFWVAILGIFFFGGGDYWDLFPIRGLGGEAYTMDPELARRLITGLLMAAPLPVILGVSGERRNRLIMTGVLTATALILAFSFNGMPDAASHGILALGAGVALLSALGSAPLRVAGTCLLSAAVLGPWFAVSMGTVPDLTPAADAFPMIAELARVWSIDLAGGESIPVYGDGVWLLDRVHHLIMPVTCLTYASFASISRFQRTSLLEVIRQDFVRTARAKGLPEKVVIWKHAVRNALIPIVTLLGATLPYLVGGSVIIETIFTIPGLGSLGFESILNRDYSVVMAIALMSAVLTMFGILVSDLTYALVDPRISYDD